MKIISVEKYLCPPGEFRIGAFGDKWTEGFAVRVGDELLKDAKKQICCFKSRKIAEIVAEDISKNSLQLG